MKIIMYDGSTLECEEIEFSDNGKKLIVDGYRLVEMVDVIRIVS